MKPGKKAGVITRSRRKGELSSTPAPFVSRRATPSSSAPFKRPLRSSVFSRRNVFKALYLLSKEKGVKVYLVGGALRNLYLSRPFEPDIDFVLDDGIDDFPDAAAARLGGKSFILDKETKAARVIVKKGGITPFAPKTYTLDFSPMDGGDIIHDLEKRDFTVNATAVELSSIFEGAELKVIDPCEGIADAEKKVLAATNKRVFKEDPLRCLRAIRLSLQCGLAISPAAFVLLKVSAHLLKNTSVERIRDELLRIFSCAGAAQGLKTIFKTGINDTALPETRGWAGIGLKGYDLLTHSLKTLEEAESFLADFRVEFPRHSKRLARHFSSSIGGVKRGVFLKVCAFFHDMNGADTAMSLAKRLRMSRKLAAGFSSVVKNHHRFFAYAQLKEKNARAKAHFFRAAGGSLGVDVVFIALAHAMATRKRGYPEVKKAAGELLEYYYGVFTRKRQGPILTGAQVMRIFGVSEGPLVGEMLEGISGAVEAGAVTNKKEAVEYIQSRFFPNGQGHGD